MSQHELQERFPDFVNLVGPGSHYKIRFDGVQARSNERCPSTRFRFYRADPARAVRLKFLVMAKCWNSYACSLCCLQDRHAFLRLYFFSVNLQKDSTHLFLLSLFMILASSGIGGGTGSPEIFVAAPKRVGQTSKHVPHFVHFSWSMT
jgi:hypothetical protein